MSPRTHAGHRPPAEVGHLPRRRRLTLYAIALGVWLTGGIWLIYHYFVHSVDQFGFENPSPLQHGWLIAHAAFSFAALWMFGVLWPIHVKKSWKVRVRRPTGGTLFGFVAWLVLTGFALYYLGHPSWRSWTSLLHWIVGLAGVIPFLVHLLTRPPRAGGMPGGRANG